jgi:hypothetical protein
MLLQRPFSRPRHLATVGRTLPPRGRANVARAPGATALSASGRVRPFPCNTDRASTLPSRFLHANPLCPSARICCQLAYVECDTVNATLSRHNPGRTRTLGSLQTTHLLFCSSTAMTASTSLASVTRHT